MKMMRSMDSTAEQATLKASPKILPIRRHTFVSVCDEHIKPSPVSAEMLAEYRSRWSVLVDDWRRVPEPALKSCLKSKTEENSEKAVEVSLRRWSILSVGTAAAII
jgi:hypothetical protein